MLGRRDYTRAELRDRLLAKEHDPQETDEVIAAFVADGTLDDRRAGAAHVRTANRIKGRGRLRIARELEARGIDRTLAKELAGEVSTEDEAGGITRVLLRKRVPARMSAEERRKVFQQLLRRGFSADVIAEALRRHAHES